MFVAMGFPGLSDHVSGAGCRACRCDDGCHLRRMDKGGTLAHSTPLSDTPKGHVESKKFQSACCPSCTRRFHVNEVQMVLVIVETGTRIAKSVSCANFKHSEWIA